MEKRTGRRTKPNSFACDTGVRQGPSGHASERKNNPLHDGPSGLTSRRFLSRSMQRRMESVRGTPGRYAKRSLTGRRTKHWLTRIASNAPRRDPQLASGTGADGRDVMPASGQSLGPYRILDKLGEVGMGEARDTKLDRGVAVKELPAQLTADSRYSRAPRILASRNPQHAESEELLCAVSNCRYRRIRRKTAQHLPQT